MLPRCMKSRPLVAHDRWSPWTDQFACETCLCMKKWSLTVDGRLWQRSLTTDVTVLCLVFVLATVRCLVCGPLAGVVSLVVACHCWWLWRILHRRSRTHACHLQILQIFYTISPVPPFCACLACTPWLLLHTIQHKLPMFFCFVWNVQEEDGMDLFSQAVDQ